MKLNETCPMRTSVGFCRGSRVEGKMSRVESKMSRVENKMSRVEGKMSRVQKYVWKLVSPPFSS